MQLHFKKRCFADKHSLPSSRHHLINDDCLEHKRECSSELFCAVLCTTVVHNDAHTHEQFLKLSVGLYLGFACLFWFSIFVFSALAWTILFVCCLLLLC